MSDILEFLEPARKERVFALRAFATKLGYREERLNVDDDGCDRFMWTKRCPHCNEVTEIRENGRVFFCCGIGAQLSWLADVRLLLGK